MIVINVSGTLDQAKAMVETMTTRNFNFSVVRALTWTAKDAQKDVVDSLDSRFKIRRTWVPKGIRIVPATISNPTATIYSKDEFMSRQEDGSDKLPKVDRNLAIPLASVRRNKSDIITKAQYPIKIPNTLKGKGGKMVASITTKDGDKFLVKLNAKRKRSKGNRLTFLYSLRKQAKIKPRLGLVETSIAAVKKMFGQRLEESIKAALSKPKP